MSMKIDCVRCHKEYDITQEKLDKIQEIQLEELSPQGLLDYFQFIAERCEKEGFKDKKHKFRWHAEYRDEVDSTITELNKTKKKLENGTLEIDRLTIDLERLSKLIAEQKKIQSTLLENVDILREKYKDLTGTDKIEWWTAVTTEETKGTKEIPKTVKTEIKPDTVKEDNSFSENPDEFVYNGLNVVGTKGESIQHTIVDTVVKAEAEQQPKAEAEQQPKAEADIVTIAEINKVSALYNIEVNVIDLEEVQSPKIRQKGTVKDESGQIIFTIWENTGSKVPKLEEYKRYVLKNVKSRQDKYGNYEITINNESTVEQKNG